MSQNETNSFVYICAYLWGSSAIQIGSAPRNRIGSAQRLNLRRTATLRELWGLTL